MTPYQQAIRDRAAIKNWLQGALSLPVREYRLSELCNAFGLTRRYVLKYVNGGAVMGDRLRAQIIEWCNAHPDLSPNQPPEGGHWLGQIDTGQG